MLLQEITHYVAKWGELKKCVTSYRGQCAACWQWLNHSFPTGLVYKWCKIPL